jgi:biopolymer transport protein ExbB
MHKLLLELRQKRTEEALALCRRNNAMGVVFENGIEMMGKPVRDIESILEASANVEVTKMEKNIAYLGIIAGIAPILGFIGTISGVISIFYNISITDNVSIGIIADGLYQKMISSGTGLLVGIIAYSCYHILQMRIDRFTRRLQEAELSFIKMLMQ